MKRKTKVRMACVVAALIATGGGSIYGWNTYIHPPQTKVYQVEIERQFDTLAAISKVSPMTDPQVRQMIADSVDKYSKINNLDPALVVAVIGRESSFVTIAKSTANCVGLMQINPAAHKDKIKGIKYYDLYYIDNNISIGCSILSDCLKQSKTVKEALRRYVGGDHPTYIPDVLESYCNLTLADRG